MGPREHYESLVAAMSEEDKLLHDKMTNAREELAYSGRNLIVYKMDGRTPVVLDIFTVQDFDCDDLVGASTVLRSRRGVKTTVSYKPVRLGEHDVFVFLPLHSKVRWSIKPIAPTKGYLGFPLMIRVQSRFSPADRGGTQCETEVNFAKEFGFDARKV